MRDLFFLTCGHFRIPSFAVDPPRRLPSLRARRLSNTVAVVVRESGDVLLVDCGWSEEACADPRGVIGRARSRLIGMRVAAGDAIATQLRALGIDRGRVKTIIATHLHLDHVGGAVDFPNAEVICADVELSAFRTLRDRGGYRARDLVRTGRLRPVTVEGAPSYGFPGSYDLLGDGQVVLLDAHGHTAGSIAVALRPRAPGSGCYVALGDAVYQSWEYALAPSGPSIIARATAWRRSAMEKRYESLRACEADPRRPMLVPSHDQAIFVQLPHAPARRFERVASAAS